VNEKLVAGVVTAVGVAPLCAVCVLGPAAIGSALAGASAWLGGAGALLTVALMVVAGLLLHRTLRRSHRPIGTASEERRAPRPPAIENCQLGAPGIDPGVWPSKQGERP